MVDVSNKRDVISLGARLQGGKQMIEGSNKGVLGSHSLKTLFAQFENRAGILVEHNYLGGLNHVPIEISSRTNVVCMMFNPD